MKIGRRHLFGLLAASPLVPHVEAKQANVFTDCTWGFSDLIERWAPPVGGSDLNISWGDALPPIRVGDVIRICGEEWTCIASSEEGAA